MLAKISSTENIIAILSVIAFIGIILAMFMGAPIV